ncbi:MAG TPA: hypothetical protein ENH29_03815, partial [Bacteroidetes bacterium]|nr:hypothetical protein [Bacteroidota bacterium]
MQINLTKKEYKILLEVLTIADWVLHAHKDEEDAGSRKYRALEQKIYSLAAKTGAKNLVEYNEEYNMFFATSELEENSDVVYFIEEFENDTFWEELIDRLALRDQIAEEGEDAFAFLSPKERFRRKQPLLEKYQDEFAENGLDNLRLI